MRLERSLLDSIRSDVDYAIVDWAMGNTCNFHCSYCPTNLHNGTSPWPAADSWDHLLGTFQGHFKKPIQYILSGGEPTLMPRFQDFLRRIKEHNSRNLTAVITNGSRSIRWWQQNGHLIDNVIVSAHVEHTNAEHILDVASVYYKPGWNELNVLLPILPERWDDTIELATELASRSNGFGVSLKRLRKKFGSESYDYDDYQEYILGEYGVFNKYDSSWHQPNPKPGRVAVPHTIRWKDGTEEPLIGNQLINKGLNVFTGINCYIGLDKIFIHPNRIIQSAAWCPQGSNPNVIGTIDDIDNAEWPEHPVICDQPRCMNASDMRTRKHW